MRGGGQYRVKNPCDSHSLQAFPRPSMNGAKGTRDSFARFTDRSIIFPEVEDNSHRRNVESARSRGSWQTRAIRYKRQTGKVSDGWCGTRPLHKGRESSPSASAKT